VLAVTFAGFYWCGYISATVGTSPNNQTHFLDLGSMHVETGLMAIKHL
jgi:hypothetical protein